MVERHLAKVEVAGSSPVFRSKNNKLKMGNAYLTIHIISIIYCFYRLAKRYQKIENPGMIGVTPGFDAVMVVFVAPFLALVDIALTWIRLYKEAEEARRRGNDINE